MQSLIRLDQFLTAAMNRTSDWKGVGRFFTAVSFLGDGKFWYGLMLALPCYYGILGWKVCIHMAVVGLVTLAVYKTVKQLTRRQRPGIAHADIRLVTAPLDEYSFPSGHTMHAVAFSVVAVAYFPHLLVPLGLFSVLVSLSRVVLGLHYPTDVILGVFAGLTIGKLSFLMIP